MSPTLPPINPAFPAHLQANRPAALVALPWHGLHEPQPQAASASNPLLLEQCLARLAQVARSAHNYAVLNVCMAYAPSDSYRLGRDLYHTEAYSLGRVIVSNEEQLVEVLRAADARVDVLLLDIDRRRLFGPQTPANTARALLHQARLLTYSDGRTWAEALKDQLVRLLGEDLQGKRVVIVGNDVRSRSLVPKLSDFGPQITILMREEEIDGAPDLARLSTEPSPEVEYLPLSVLPSRAERADAVVVWRDLEGDTLGQYIRPQAYLLDAGLRSIPQASLALAQQRGAWPVRVQIIPTLLGALLAAHEQASSVDQAFGWGELAGVALVSGGAIGVDGAVVVDRVGCPRRVLGLADGWGGMRQPATPQELARLKAVEQAIADSDCGD